LQLPTNLNPEIRTDADILLQYYMKNCAEEWTEDIGRADSIETIDVGDEFLDEDRQLETVVNDTPTVADIFAALGQHRLRENNHQELSTRLQVTDDVYNLTGINDSSDNEDESDEGF
jgi:hypothetical protein